MNASFKIQNIEAWYANDRRIDESLLSNTTTCCTLDTRCTDSNTTAEPMACKRSTGPSNSVSTSPAQFSANSSDFFTAFTLPTQPQSQRFAVFCVIGPARLIPSKILYCAYLWCLPRALALLALLLLWAFLLAPFSWSLLYLGLSLVPATWQVSQLLSVILLVLVQLFLSPPLPLFSFLSDLHFPFFKLSFSSLFSFLQLMAPLLFSLFQLPFPLLSFFFFLSSFLLHSFRNDLLVLDVQVDNLLFELWSVSLFGQNLFRVNIIRGSDFEVKCSQLFTNFMDLLFNLIKTVFFFISEMR